MDAKKEVVAALRDFGWDPGAGPVDIGMEQVRGLAARLLPITGEAPLCAMVAGTVTNEFPDIEAAWSDWLATFQDYTLEATEINVRPFGVVGLGRQWGRTAHAGIEIEHEAGVLFLMPGDRIERVEFHIHHATTLAAAEAQSGQE